jgi:carbon starvation protein
MLLACIVVLVTVGRWYSRFLAKQFGEDPSRSTPATVKNDGRDYVPTPTPVVFGHHFASIAGAGPIVGPVLAICYGWGPAIVWVLLGGLFIGGVHDYLAAFMSMRNDGQSMATIARRLLGRGPFIALMIFLVLMLGLVTAVFLNTSATALVSMIEFGRMKLADDQTIFRVVTAASGEQNVVIGGVASMSVIIVTACAPLVGWLYIKKQVAVWKCSLLAIAVCAVSIVVGLYAPVAFPETIESLGGMKGTDLWKVLLSIYVLFAAGVPVWMFLQSRDFINVHILYGGVILLVVTLAVAALRAPVVADAPVPAFDAETGSKFLGWFWPGIFITIACGAVSGFHSLCAGGTTCKQLKSEAATRHIGYWGMLLETMLAVCVITILMVGTTKAEYLVDVYPAGKGANPVLGFAFAVGNAAHIAFGLPIAAGALAGMLLLEGFVITTLDTAVRLNRYLIEEIWQELFGTYDVFAAVAARSEAAQALAGEEPAGSGGIPPAVAGAASKPYGVPIATAGAFRACLQFLRFYWVNSGIAVGLMLGLSVSAGILQLWNLFGTGNQLLAAFVLGIGTVWLLRNGRKVWYIVVPALLMLVTTVASLIQLILKFMPRVVDGKETGNATLFAADVVLILLTAYLVVAGVGEILRLVKRPAAQPAAAS